MCDASEPVGDSEYATKQSFVYHPENVGGRLSNALRTRHICDEEVSGDDPIDTTTDVRLETCWKEVTAAEMARVRLG